MLLKGALNEAELAIDRALVLNPLDELTLLEQAKLAQVRGQDERAEAITTDLIASNPDNVGALTVLGKIYRRRGNVDEAYTLTMSALSVDSSDPEAHELLAGVKLSRNPIGGLFGHVTRLLQSVGERKLIWLLWFIYIGYLFTLTTMNALGVSDDMRNLFVLIYVLFWVGMWSNRGLIERMVRKELEEFRFSRSY